MPSKELDLSKMTVDDLFRAKRQRRQRLARLPFEQKIEIVKRLQAVSTQVGFFSLVHDDLLAAISLDLGIQISRFSPAMIPTYVRGQWLYDIHQTVIRIERWLTGKEASVQGLADYAFIPRLILGAQLRSAIDSLPDNGDKPESEYESSQPEYWRQRLPISFVSFDSDTGTWIAEWFVDPAITPNKDFILFDIKFNRNIQPNVQKRLQLQIQVAALNEDSSQNIWLVRPYVTALLESTETFDTVSIQAKPA